MARLKYHAPQVVTHPKDRASAPDAPQEITAPIWIILHSNAEMATTKTRWVNNRVHSVLQAKLVHQNPVLLRIAPSVISHCVLKPSNVPYALPVILVMDRLLPCPVPTQLTLKLTRCLASWDCTPRKA